MSSQPQPDTVADPPPDKPRVGWRRYIHSFVIIPACVALLFVTLAYVLTSSRRERGVMDYLETIQEGNSNARWQAAVELSRRLSEPGQVPGDADFVPVMLDLFRDEAMYREDPRVRLFLALAMGRSAQPEFFDPLMAALAGADKVEELSVYIRAAGFMGNADAVSRLLPLLEHTDAVVRHEAVQALGFIGSKASAAGLRPLLADPEPNVRWDAAIALAKLRDPAAKDMLMNLLDREYYEAFPDVRPEGRAWAMEVAVRSAARLNDPDLNARIKLLSESDPNIKVRGAALEVAKGQ